MTTSTDPENAVYSPELDAQAQIELSEADKGGAFADALTFLRIAMTPVIMALIVWGWPELQVALLASFLFIVAALTDIFDDFFGGSARSQYRRYGYLDDIADTILFVGVLLALAFVLFRADLVSWTWAIPVAVLIGRELLVGLFKGFELSRYGWADNLYSSAKGGFAMLGTALLVGSPWLTQWIDMTRATPDNAIEVLAGGSPLVWVIGEVALWIAAVFSVIAGIKILTHTREVDAA